MLKYNFVLDILTNYNISKLFIPKLHLGSFINDIHYFGFLCSTEIFKKDDFKKFCMEKGGGLIFRVLLKKTFFASSI